MDGMRSDEQVQREIDERWRERGWPPELLERARAAHVPPGRLERMLIWNANPDRVSLEVGWAERALNGTIRWRQLTIDDNEAFCELWANSPEEIGEWDVTAERGPNGFAQFALQERPVLNALFDGHVMVACVSFALRYTLVGGQRISIHYGQAMRVHRDHRRHGYANWVRSLPWAVGFDRPTQVQYDYIRAGNMTMERWNSKFMNIIDSVPKREGEVPGIPVTVQQFPAKSTAPVEGVRTATPDDLDQCVALINRTHAGRDIFRPYTREFLQDRIETSFAGRGTAVSAPIYGYEAYYVLERANEIVACAGLWDRGRDLRERWRHRETGAERTLSVAALLDFGFAAGQEQPMASLVEHLIGRTHELGRDYLVVPLETLPEVAARLAQHNPEPETRYLQWRTDSPPLSPPTHVDLVYW
jgi:hypothetical protein